MTASAELVKQASVVQEWKYSSYPWVKRGPRCPLNEVLPPNPNEPALRLPIAGTCELPVRGAF